MSHLVIVQPRQNNAIHVWEAEDGLAPINPSQKSWSPITWGNGDFGDSGWEPLSWILDCCLYPAGAADGGGFTFEGPQVHEDPLFCDARDRTEAPTSEGDYAVAPGSPCLPENNACGAQLGALGLGDCDPASITPPMAEGGEPKLRFTCPLPVREELRFRTSIDGDSEAQLIDLTGRVVMSRTFRTTDGAELVWDLGSVENQLRNGVYFLRLRSLDGTKYVSQKFVWLDH